MQNKADIQESQYSFPYHYLTISENEDFTLSKYLQWGLIHESYLQYITNQILMLKPNKVLDAGCGDGRLFYELEKNLSSSKMVGIDISERALNFARGFTKNSTFLVHDIISQPTKTKFDLCTSIEVIEHIPPEKIGTYVNNISQSLEENGILVLTTPTTNLPTQRKHYQHFDLKKIENYLKSDFIIEQVYYLNKENYWSRLLGRMLANKFFIINHRFTRNLVFKFYKSKFLHAKSNTGSRIYIKARKAN